MTERGWIGGRAAAERSGRIRARAARVGAATLLTVAGSWLSGPQARGQVAGGLLPATGITAGSTASLRSAVEGLLPGATTVNTGPAWRFGASVDAQVGAVKDSGAGRSQGWQFYSQISPDLSVTGDTPRLQVRLNYDPVLQFFGSSSDATRIYHNFNGSASATLVPDHLFLDARAFTNVGSRFGTQAQSTSFFSRGEAVQSTGFSLSPHYTQQFGGWGTFTAGYTFTRSLQDSDNGFANQVATVNGVGTIASPGFGTTGNLTTHQEYANFVTGENLGRFQYALSASGTQYSGSANYYQGSHREELNNRFSYALRRWITLIANVGYEEIHYGASGTLLGYSTAGMTWSVGGTLTPNPDSSITVLYGRQEGATTVSVDASYSPTPRTRLYTTYSSGVDTGLGQRQRLLQNTVVGTGGLLLDQRTGLPVAANSLSGSEFGVSRVKRLSIGAFWQLPRDTLGLSVVNEDRTQLVQSTSVFGVTTAPGTSTNSKYGTLSWQHDLDPVTSLSSSVTYAVYGTGVYFGNPGQSQDSISAGTVLTRTFTQTLSGSVSYSYTERYGGATRNVPSSFGGASSENLLLVGLRKTF